MSRNKAKFPPYRLNVKLDQDRDADLVSWLESLPTGNRSQAIREVLRAGLGRVDNHVAVFDLEAIREVMKAELTRALAVGSSTPITPPTVQTGENTVEAKYGARLDKMLSGLKKQNDNHEAG